MGRDNLHRLAEERSLALHRAIAALLLDRPDVLDRARARVRGWLVSGAIARPYALLWEELLDRSPATIAALLVEESERMRALRQVTPFAGAVAPRERWRIWSAVRERWEREP